MNVSKILGLNSNAGLCYVLSLTPHPLGAADHEECQADPDLMM